MLKKFQKGGARVKECIADLLDKQNEIIKLQTEIIDRLAAVVLQHGMIGDEELRMMQQAAKMQGEVVS